MLKQLGDRATKGRSSLGNDVPWPLTGGGKTIVEITIFIWGAGGWSKGKKTKKFFSFRSGGEAKCSEFQARRGRGREGQKRKRGGMLERKIP